MKYMILFFLLSFTSVSQAQLLGRLGNGVNRAINNEIGKIGDRVAEKLAQQIIESILSGRDSEAQTDSLNQYAESIDSTNSANTPALDLGSLLGGASSAKVDKSFSFDYELTCKITSGEHTSNMLFYLPKEGPFVGYKISSVFLIMDYETEETYTIVNGSLTSLNMMKVMKKNMVGASENEDYVITKTGRSKDVAGYPTEEYLMRSDESEIRLWLTTEIINDGISNSKYIRDIAEGQHVDYPQGIALLIESKDMKTEAITTMEFTKIEQVETTIDLADY